MNQHRLTLHKLLGICAWMSITAAHAAPTSDAAANLQTDQRSGADTLPRATGATPPAGTPTLDLLIQLNPPGGGIEPKEGSGLALKPRPGLLPGTEKPAQRAGGPATAPAVRATPAQPMAVPVETRIDQDWQAAAQTRASPPAQRNEPGEPAPRFLQFPREVFLFIRENREWALGGTALALGLIWAVSSAVARRRG
jgi:hypothetical protein